MPFRCIHCSLVLKLARNKKSFFLAQKLFHSLTFTFPIFIELYYSFSRLTIYLYIFMWSGRTFANIFAFRIYTFLNFFSQKRIAPIYLFKKIFVKMQKPDFVHIHNMLLFMRLTCVLQEHLITSLKFSNIKISLFLAWKHCLGLKSE